MKKIDALPTQDDYTNIVRETARQYPIGNKEDLVRYFQKKMGFEHSFRAHLNQAAELGFVLEPFDRTSGAALDLDFPMSAPFQFGYGYGLLATTPFFGQITAKDLLSQIHAPVPGGEDRLHDKHQLAAIIVEAGEQGMALIGERAADELEEIETKIIHDATKQRYFRIGAGVVFYATHTTIGAALEDQKSHDLAALRATYEGLGNQDWDGALQDLLGGER